jgi:2-C-methyl-D-erythritol 4-phosphate cytidylyltransferase/2-C-methyl-D-erythritol 2,4-cyclodiphosphate synthase
MYVTAIIAAGGRGQRLGGVRPKQFLEIGGRAVLERSVAAFLGHPQVDDVVVALPADLAGDPPAYLRGTAKPLRIVAGGERRQDSVANAFRAIGDRADVIVIHDAARPFASAALIGRTIAAAAESGAALAALPARDTVKQGEGGMVRATLPRESIFLAQTPQAFRRDVLRDALALGDQGADATDEAALAERAGHSVRIVEGETSNIKITTAEDLSMAEAILRNVDFGSRRESEQSEIRNPKSALPARTGRAGIGYDLHRLVEGRPLILGGVTIPFEKGLLGHSDADAVCHAITDAILGAAGAGDIGRHFPDTDAAWKDASSIDLLRRAAEVVAERGLEVGNVDASVIAERPKLAPFIDAMCANVARAIGIPADRVSIKGKTNEGVGALGRGEAIAVHAIALLRKR